MENASKALIIAGSVLISVMVLAVGVYLYRQGNNFASSTAEKTTSSTLQNFNSKFEVYETEYSYGTTIDTDLERYGASTRLNTISEVISAVNKAVSLNSVNNYSYKYISSMGVETENAVEIFIDLAGVVTVSGYKYFLIEPNQYISTGYVYGLSNPGGTTREQRLRTFNNTTVTSEAAAASCAVSTNVLLSELNETKVKSYNGTNYTLYRYYFSGTCLYDEDLGQVNSVVFRLIEDVDFDSL